MYVAAPVRFKNLISRLRCRISPISIPGLTDSLVIKFLFEYLNLPRESRSDLKLGRSISLDRPTTTGYPFRQIVRVIARVGPRDSASVRRKNREVRKRRRSPDDPTRGPGRRRRGEIRVKSSSVSVRINTPAFSGSAGEWRRIPGDERRGCIRRRVLPKLLTATPLS